MSDRFKAQNLSEVVTALKQELALLKKEVDVLDAKFGKMEPLEDQNRRLETSLGELQQKWLSSIFEQLERSPQLSVERRAQIYLRDYEKEINPPPPPEESAAPHTPEGAGAPNGSREKIG
jgi:hypothetical protein